MSSQRTRTGLAAGLILAALLAFPRAASAHPWGRLDVGIGLSLGGPTALSLDFRLHRTSSVELAIGLDALDDDDGNAYAHLEYVLRPFYLVHKPSLALPLYLGAGVFVSEHGRDLSGDDLHVGARFPFGLAFEFRPPLLIFLELGVYVFLVETDDHPGDHGVAVDGAGGFRIYF